MKNIRLIRMAVMLVLVSSVFIFGACAKGEGRKITDKDIADTTWTIFPDETQIKFNKNKNVEVFGNDSMKISWKITKIKIEDYIAARIGLGNPEDMMDNTKNSKNTTVHAVIVKSKDLETGEEYTDWLIAADKFFNGYSWKSDNNFLLLDYKMTLDGDTAVAIKNN